MLVHVFENLLAEDESTSFFMNFLLHAGKAIEVRDFRRDGEYLEIRVTKKSGSKKKLTWSSGVLFQKLMSTSSKRTLPVVWKMGRYLHGGDIDTSSEIVQTYLRDNFKLSVEAVPFTLESNGRLSTRCKISRDQVPKEIDDRKVKITVDKHDLTVTILPHRGLVQTLLSSLLKGFL